MGMLDAILGSMSSADTNAATADAQAVHPGLMDAAMKMLGDKSSGGLSGLLAKFNAAGLSSQVASWVGSGPNAPVSGDQVHSALGAGQIAALAAKFGISPAQVSSHLAQLLPELVNHVTPTGQVPEHHGMIETALAMLKAKFQQQA